MRSSADSLDDLAPIRAWHSAFHQHTTSTVPLLRVALLAHGLLDGCSRFLAALVTVPFLVRWVLVLRPLVVAGTAEGLLAVQPNGAVAPNAVPAGGSVLLA